MRSTQRLTGKHGALLVVDLQDKLLASISGRDLVVANTIGVDPSRQNARPAGLGHRTVSKGTGPDRRRGCRVDFRTTGEDDLSLSAPFLSSWNSFTAAMSAM